MEHAPTIVDGSQVQRAKPAPDLLLRAAERLELPPADCWAVGDSIWDMRAADAAGMQAVAVTAGAGVSAEALTEAGAAVVVQTLAELEERLRAISGPMAPSGGAPAGAISSQTRRTHPGRMTMS